MITANLTYPPLHQLANNTLQFALFSDGAYLDASTITSATLRLCHGCKTDEYMLPDLNVVTVGADKVLQLPYSPEYYGGVKVSLLINGLGCNLSNSILNVIQTKC